MLDTVKSELFTIMRSNIIMCHGDPIGESIVVINQIIKNIFYTNNANRCNVLWHSVMTVCTSDPHNTTNNTVQLHSR